MNGTATDINFRQEPASAAIEDHHPVEVFEESNIHCPRCGTKMITNYNGITESGLRCPKCHLLAIWSCRKRTGMLQWSDEALRP